MWLAGNIYDQVLYTLTVEPESEELGAVFCEYCGEELQINRNNMDLWESETLLAFCPKGLFDRHKPLKRPHIDAA